MTGRKTKEQQIRTLERKPDYPDARRMEEELDHTAENAPGRVPKHPGARQSEFPVSRQGMHEESRHHKPDRERE
jgi:hypothetical protein